MENERRDFIDEYLSYTTETEAHRVCHRWVALSIVGAILGRSCYIQHGHFRIFPNIFSMLIGDAGARKSTAIKLGKKLITASGYDYLGADKTSKEKFLLDLEGAEEGDVNPLYLSDKKDSTKKYDDVMAKNLWGEDSLPQDPKEMFIMADEWNEYAGSGNIDFYTTLGNLWDWDDPVRPFTQRLKNSKSVNIYQPTVNIIGGNTQENFARSFPPEIIGSGFLSRMILIYCERSGRKYTFPPTPSQEATDGIVDRIRNLRKSTIGPVSFTDEAVAFLDKIYSSHNQGSFVGDVRFGSYNQRRFTQVLKLALCYAAARGDDEISKDIIILSNTTLSAAECLMPKALGEFGKSRNSDVANRVMEVLDVTNRPLTIKDLWRVVHQDLDKPQQLVDILHGLQTAERVFLVKEPYGWLPKKAIIKENEFVNWDLLSDEEQALL